jgi:DNA-binding FrmR family transcriptional regulator
MTKNNQETQYSRYYLANLLTNAEILVLETHFKTCQETPVVETDKKQSADPILEVLSR